MKIYRTTYLNILTFYLPFFGLYAFWYCFDFTQLLSFKTIHWIFLALAILLAFISPQRNTQHHNESARLSLPLWLLSILSFVSLLSAFFYFTHQFLAIKNPSLDPVSSYATLLKTSGLFPWALIALFAVAIQRTYHHEKQWGYFNLSLMPLFHCDALSEIGKYANTTIRYPIFIALTLTMMFIGLGCLHLFSQISGISLSSGTNLLTLFSSTLMFYIIAHSNWRLYFNKLINYRCPVILALLIMLIFGCALFAAPLVIIKKFSEPNLQNINYFNTKAWPQCWETVNTFIALSWVPLASATIASISRGYKAWQITSATLLIPSLLAFKEDWKFFDDSSNNTIALIICAIVLLSIFLKPWVLTHAWRGLYPTTQHPRISKPTIYLRSLVIASLTLIGIYWVSDVYLLTLILSTFTISATLMLMISTGYWILFKRKNREDCELVNNPQEEAKNPLN